VEDNEHKKGMMDFFDSPSSSLPSKDNPGPYRRYLQYSAAINPEIVKHFLRNSSHGVVLDLGCGDCSNVLPCLQEIEELQIVGIDLSFPSLARAKTLVREAETNDRLEVIQADGLHPPFREEVFCSWLVLNVFHHYFQGAMIGQVVKTVREGGLILVVETVFNNPFRFLAWQFRNFLPRTVHSMIPELEDVGGLPPRIFFAEEIPVTLARYNCVLVWRHSRELLLVTLPIFHLLFPQLENLNMKFLVSLNHVEDSLANRTQLRHFTSFAVFQFRKQA